MFYFLQLGMDQSKTNLPHFPSPPKSIVSLLYLPIHLVGNIVHGKGVEVFLEEGKRWPHDTNLTLHVLLESLKKHKTKQDVLYLQLDNCSRENKNKWVLYSVLLLVKKRIFRKVRDSADFLSYWQRLLNYQ